MLFSKCIYLLGMLANFIVMVVLWLHEIYNVNVAKGRDIRDESFIRHDTYMYMYDVYVVYSIKPLCI